LLRIYSVKFALKEMSFSAGRQKTLDSPHAFTIKICGKQRARPFEEPAASPFQGRKG